MSFGRIGKPLEAASFDLDDDDGWQDMPIVREVDPNLALDEEDQQKYHYVAPSKSRETADPLGSNAIGNLIDYDDRGQEWREKTESNEDDYTRLKLDEDDDADEAYLRTKYLFDEDKAMTPLSQMQATKNLLTEAQRIAYVGVCSLVARQMSQMLAQTRRKELAPAIKGLELWRLRIMGRIYYHMELETDEQKMIESLGEHGVDPMDLVPALMATRTVANPEYDPVIAKQKAFEDEERLRDESLANEELSTSSIDATTTPTLPPYSPTTNAPHTPAHGSSLLHAGASIRDQTTANVLQPNEPTSVPGVSTTLSSTDENVTLDIRWTVLCDLFLILIADSVYDSRSRMLLETVAAKLGLGWLDVVRFEKRVTDALEIQEGVEQLGQTDVIEQRSKAAQKRRYVMMGLATLGGGLVIGLSAGLLAPVIGVGLGAAFSTIGVTGTSAFLSGVGGAAVITTAGTLTGSGIAAKGMSRRTRQVRTFDLLPLHNNKRVSCIVTVPGFMASERDDVRLPFSVLDPLVGDVFSVRWEPEMMGEMGDALKILTSEVLSQVGTTVLQATVMTALMSALQWPIILTKLGYLIDNPWSNALDRAHAAGLVLADVLLNRSLGVRPITLIGFSLGARVIFYALVELAKQKAFGIVQDVFLLGATVTANQKAWLEVRGVVAGRFVNGFARNDWVLNYLFRATTGGGTVAGLRPIDGIPGLENVDVTDKIAGHLSYRTYMPVILDQLGFPVSATYFDEPEEPDMDGDREVIRQEELAAREAAKKKRFTLFKSKPKPTVPAISSSSSSGLHSKSPSQTSQGTAEDDDDLPARIERPSSAAGGTPSQPPTPSATDPPSNIPAKAGFDFNAITKALGKERLDPSTIPIAPQEPKSPRTATQAHLPPERTGSAPPPLPTNPIPNPEPSDAPTPKAKFLPLGHESVQDDNPIPFFQRSLSVDDTSTATFEREQSHSSSLSTPPEPYSSFPSSSRAQVAPSWPPPSSLLSFASSEGAVWSSSSTNDYSSTLPSASTSGLRRQAPPAVSFGSFDTASFASAVGPAPSVPQLSFGSVDGSVVPLDDASAAATRDAWAPKPIGLSAALSKKSGSYTLNPWDA